MTVTNVGTVACIDVIASLPEGVDAHWESSKERTVLMAERLDPGEREGRRFMDFHGWNELDAATFHVEIQATAEDGEPVTSRIRISPHL